MCSTGAPVTRTVILQDGLSLNFAETNSKASNVVLFVHGYADSWVSYEPLMRVLSTDFRCIALDLRGHGDSDKTFCCYSLDDYVHDLKLLHDALNLGLVVLVGHSMGGFIVQKYAHLYPNDVSKLILISSSTKAVGNVVLSSLLDVVDNVADPVDEKFIREFQSVDAPVPSGFMEKIISESKKMPARIWKITLHKLLEMDNTDLLDEVKAKTMVVRGGGDVIFSKCEQDELFLRIHGSQFVVYKAGHAVHWEVPEQLGADIVKFIAGHD